MSKRDFFPFFAALVCAIAVAAAACGRAAPSVSGGSSAPTLAGMPAKSAALPAGVTPEMIAAGSTSDAEIRAIAAYAWSLSHE